jgi:signal transduction histidine kinase/DNA-binding NarL/FixJ family response regulator
MFEELGTQMTASGLDDLQARLSDLRKQIDGLVSTVEEPGWNTASATSMMQQIASTAQKLDGQVEALREVNSAEAARLDEIFEVLFGIAGLDFTRRAAVGDDGGRLDALAATCNMLSEEVEASQLAIEQQNRELRAATEAKSQFLANMSHEVRTPLGAMLGFAELLLDPDLNDSERLNCALVIRRNGEHLLAVINDILDLSKIEAGKLSVEEVEVNLASLLSEIESLMRPRALDKGLSFEVELEGEAPAVFIGDPTRIRQILLNLLGNAVKFTETGGVQVRVRYEPGEPGELLFDVVDTGIGMTDEAVGALFAPFHQADASMSRRFGGTGLGLAICKPLAEKLNGDISVVSAPGEGSTFRLQMEARLPSGTPMLTTWREAVPSRPIEGETPKAPQDLVGKVLVAEDGIDNQALITSILRRAGLRVVVVDNGKIAVDRLVAAMDAGSPFDLVVMDMQMPELDGYGATSAVRERGYAGPIIALTAHAMAGERERCIAAGCDDYLSKPFDRYDLVRMVHRHLPAPQSKASREKDGLISTYSDDPEMVELINRFVGSLSERMDSLHQARNTGDLDGLRRLSHHLKGAAGGYGFQSITDAASALEIAAIEKSGPAIADALEALGDLCSRARQVEE